MRTNPYRNAEEYRRWVTEDLREGGSEFGGVAGQIAPPPHDITTNETLHMLYRQADDSDENPDAPVLSELVASPYHREDNR